MYKRQFPTSTQTIRAAHINGSSIRSVNLDSTTTELTNVPTSTPVFLTAVESGFEGISVPAVETTDTVGIHHVYLSGAIQVTCTKCVPGSINMSGALHYSSNGTRSAGARVWTATPQDPAAGTMERQAVFPITFSTSTY